MVRNLDALPHDQLSTGCRGRSHPGRRPSRDLTLDDVWDAGLSGSGCRASIGMPCTSVIRNATSSRRWWSREQVTKTSFSRPCARERSGIVLISRRLLRHIGGYTVRGKSRAENVMGILSLTLRNPLLLVESLLLRCLSNLGQSHGSLAAVLFEAIRSQATERPTPGPGGPQVHEPERARDTGGSGASCGLHVQGSRRWEDDLHV